MFEKFGILDVLFVVKKNIKIIFFVILGCIIFFGLINLSRIKDSLVLSYGNDTSEMETFISSFYVQPIMDETPNEKTDSGFYKSLPDDYVAIANTDYCLNYVYEKILSKYEKEDIIRFAGITDDEAYVDPGELSFQFLKDAYKCKRQSGTMVINLAVKSYSKQFSEDISTYLRDFLMTCASERIKSADLEYIGSSRKTLDFSNLSQADKNLWFDSSIQSTPALKNSLSKSFLISVTKCIILPTFAILFLLLSFLILYSFFNPTLNRKSDFSVYGIPVIGEIDVNIESERKK